MRQLMRSAPQDDFLPLLDYYQTQGIHAQVATFSPAEVPALMSYPKDAEFIQEATQAIQAGELPDPFAELIGDYYASQTKNAASPDSPNLTKGILYLNANCQLVRQLAYNTPDLQARTAALNLLYQLARLFSGRTLTTTDARQAFASTIKSIEELLLK
jgi:hypothetical protein